MATPASASASKLNVTFRLATSEDREPLREAMIRYFYPEEAVNTSHYSGGEVVPDDVEFYLRLIDEAFVMIAVEDGTGQIVGFGAGGLVGKGEAQRLLDMATKTETEKFADILRFLAHLAKEANIDERAGTARVYYMYGVGVDPRFRQKKLGTMLIQKQFELARKCGATLTYGDTTGIKSAGLVRNLGMECVYSIAYNDYRDEAGRQIFVHPDPGLEVCTFIKWL